MSCTIHSTAVVEQGATLGQRVTIGPFCVVEAGAVIGDDCQLAARAIIKSHTELGAGNRVGEAVVLGGDAQHVAPPDCGGRLVIGAHNTFRENATVHRALREGQETRVGDHNMLMVAAHIGHDAQVGSHVIFANNTMVGGHASVGDRVFMGGGSAIHQFCRLGAYVMVGGFARIVQDVPPYVLIDGESSRVVGLNRIGLKRNGFAAAELNQLKQAYRIMYRNGLRWDEVVEQLRAEFATGPAEILAQFVAESERGLISERRGPRKASIRLHDSAATPASPPLRKAG